MLGRTSVEGRRGNTSAGEMVEWWYHLVKRQKIKMIIGVG